MINIKEHWFKNSSMPVKQGKLTSELEHKSSIPSIFISGIKNLTSLGEQTWIIRDGTIPLIDFFYKNRKPPKDFKAKLYIHEKSINVVASDWLDYCGTYKIICGTQDKLFTDYEQIIPNKIICLGHLSESFSTIENAQKCFFDMLKFFSNWADGIREIKYCLTHDGDLDYIFQFFSILNCDVPKIVSSMSFYEASMALNGSDFLIYNFNQMNFCSDDSDLHLLLSKGGHFSETKKANNSKFIPLSLFHGYETAELTSQKKDDLYHSKKFKSLKNYLDSPFSSANVKLDTFNSLSNWSKNLIAVDYRKILDI